MPGNEVSLMPARKVVAQEMAAFLSALSHPDRVMICLELQHGEQEVCVLRETLGISASRLSQHLGLLKSHHIISERREGRRVLCQLKNLKLGPWLIEGMGFIQQESQRLEGLVAALQQATQSWEHPDE